jgi:acetolactate synthase-1/2/3 large subunit
MKLSGSEILLKCLQAEGTKKIFGYPGGQIISVFDALYDYDNVFDNVLVRHEQGAIHAAQGYARVSGETGVVVVTSGPGATNVITGIADANIDSTPLVIITGQVASAQLGSDAFQETDMLCITLPITKWSYQIRRTEDIAWAVARAFYIAKSGRPGPVVLDFAKNAQVGEVEWNDDYQPCHYIRSYQPTPDIDPADLWEAVKLINDAKRPLLVCGQGVTLSHAEEALKEFSLKSGIPVASTLLGLSTIPSDFPNYVGMVGMHGNVAPNKMTQQCDLLIAVGCRFADRVTGPTNSYAPLAKIIHIDIDPSELNKNVKVDLGICGDAREALTKMLPLVEQQDHTDWIRQFDFYRNEEEQKVIAPETAPAEGPIRMGEVVKAVTEQSHGEAIIVTDVGQNQMIAARYSRFMHPHSMVTSGGLGTMGFGLPAAIGAKMAAPDREVVFFVGDGGIQMTIEELGTIMQEGTAVKIVVLDNTWLGMVRQWQELFFGKRYSHTRMVNPDFVKVAEAYDIRARRVTDRADLADAVQEMLTYTGPYLLHVAVQEQNMVFPMVPGGQPVDHILLSRNEKI